MPPIILFCLNRDLSRILQKHLTKSRWSEDRCVAEMLALLERPQYRRNLLFRDYSQLSQSIFDNSDEQPTLDESSEKVGRTHWDESLFYVGMLLTRRIQLANNLKHQPTNMHQVLLLLCRKNIDQRWHETTLARQLDGKAVSEEFFLTLAKILSEQHTRLQEGYSANAKSRLLEFGPYWLKAHFSSGHVAEELTLADVLRAVPCPISESLYYPTTDSFDKDWQIAFARVLETLNDRYGLLRSLGLKPEFWLDRDKPVEQGEKTDGLKSKKLLLSTDNLQELIALKNRVAADQALGSVEKSLSIDAAYRKAFDNLKGAAKKWAGFESFFDFQNSEVGHHLLGQTLEEIDTERYYSDDDELQRDQPMDEYAVQQRMRDLVEERPELFDPVMTYFFLEALGRQRGLFGQSGILEDPEFSRLTNETTQYRHLSDEELASLLEAKAKQLIRDQLQTENEDD